MKEYDLFECNMLFSTYREFKTRRKLIKEKFDDLKTKDKQIYKLYVYTRLLLTDKQKDLIWDEIKVDNLEDYVINPNLDFNSYNEYKLKRKTIMLSYEYMSIRDKNTYRFYVYNKKLPEKTKDNIWNEINGFFY